MYRQVYCLNLPVKIVFLADNGKDRVLKIRYGI